MGGTSGTVKRRRSGGKPYMPYTYIYNYDQAEASNNALKCANMGQNGMFLMDVQSCTTPRLRFRSHACHLACLCPLSWLETVIAADLLVKAVFLERKRLQQQQHFLTKSRYLLCGGFERIRDTLILIGPILRYSSDLF